ncbi:MAG: sulfur carrier protein ThiS [Deltaproteobacteria bacterium]|jgi:thiamine biosynthesis protein ThiS|nr:sulfur carrier protein ThiS [Deltaproteobacteria bacterium]
MSTINNSGGPELRFILNGEAVTCPDGQNLGGYLTSAGLDPKKVVAEINGQILKPEHFTDYLLNAGDQVEIIHFVGGG